MQYTGCIKIDHSYLVGRQKKKEKETTTCGKLWAQTNARSCIDGDVYKQFYNHAAKLCNKNVI